MLGLAGCFDKGILGTCIVAAGDLSSESQKGNYGLRASS